MNIRIPNLVIAAMLVLLLFSFVLVFAYGVAVHRYKLFPYQLIKEAERAVLWSVERAPGNMPWFYERSDRTETIIVHDSSMIEEDGLNLVTEVGADDELVIKVADMAGKLVHAWPVDWFDVWPNPTHLPPLDVPRTRPGTHVHGVWLSPDGDVVFNFEIRGLVRMGPCGEVRWKLPYQTHHSIYVDDEGNIWASGLKTSLEKLPNYPAHSPPVREQTIVKVSPDGELIEEISLFDLLDENDQRALLHLRSTPKTNNVSGDSLHLNDVEIFPETMEEGFFKHGDMVISLRNLNSIIVFDADERKIKLLQVGGFVRQHDPDFIDGNTLLIFDNNHIGPDDFGQQSRILTLDGRTKKLSTVYVGTEENPFYTSMMGKQQMLENGHMLITDSMNGRGFEIDQHGNIVWEYINIVEDGIVGWVEEVQRISPRYREVFAAASCGS